MALDIHQARFLASYGTAQQLPAATRDEIAFVGRSNSGKSSLLNKLLNRKALAKVSATPGKTSTINFFEVGHIHLVDLPGYGYAKLPNAERDRWVTLMDGYFNENRRFALILVLLDIRHLPSKLDLMMLATLMRGNFPLALILTKADKLGSSKQRSQKNAISAAIEEQLGSGLLAETPIVVSSSLKGYGIDAIRHLIDQACSP